MGQHGRRSSFARRCSAAVLGLALVAVARPVAAAGPPAGDTSDAGTVLELDGPDKVLAARFGEALRAALGKRGLDNGRRDSLVELRLAMGCVRDEPACLAKGGEALDVRRLIYGTLRERGNEQVLELSVLVVESATVQSTVSVPLSASDLEEAAIDGTAERIVVELLKEEPESPLPPAATAAPSSVDRSAPLPPPPPRVAGTNTTTEPAHPPGKIWWGLERPTPKWKWALLGTSASLVVVSTATAVGLVVATKRTLRDRLVRTANESLDDVYPEDHPLAGQLNSDNDINPTVSPDICAEARQHPAMDVENPDSVKNKEVTHVCNVADGVEKGQWAAFGILAVSAVATLVFTGLLVMHRNRATTNASARRVRMSFGRRAGGFGAALSGRF